jgi:hypothetical protein
MLAAVLALLFVSPAIAQEASAPDVVPTEAPPEASVTNAGGSNPLLPAVGGELKRWGRDSIALVTAPLTWEQRDWEKAAAFGVVLGGLFLADKSIDHQAQETRSPFTNSVSSATTPLGAEAGFGVAVALLLGGVAFESPATRDTGRDALEAGVIAGIIDNVVKRATGRVRPNGSNGETTFEPGSSNASFASGHATVAFSVASVIAARSSGWVVPTLAYTAATLVGLDRINSHAHFASDVFAGAVLGTVTGRWMVHRHEAEEAAMPKTELEIGPIANGIGAKLRF